MKVLLVMLAFPGLLDDAPPAGAGAARAVDYVREVKPLIARYCVVCHGPVKPRAGLRLDTAAAMRQGGDGGPAVVAGASAESPLIEAVLGTGEGERMPLKRPPLSPAEVDTLRAWVDQGAKAPADETPTSAAPVHWAFVLPRRPLVPA